MNIENPTAWAYAQVAVLKLTFTQSLILLVLGWYWRTGPKTAQQIADMIGGHVWTTRRYCREMAKKGLLRETPPPLRMHIGPGRLMYCYQINHPAVTGGV